MLPRSPSGYLGISSKARFYGFLAVAFFFVIAIAVVAMGLYGITSVPFLIFCSFLLVCGLIVLLPKRTKRRRTHDYDIEKEFSTPLSGLPVRFSYEELRTATRNFNEKLGDGGFGSVFKGILEDGTIVAVKRLDKQSKDMKQLIAEVKSIGRIHHFNVVNLIGYCVDNSFQLLVYEYVVNGSLDNWIFNQDKSHRLNWETRKNIAIGVARGLSYLHHECSKKIIHLDIKPQNILLDENFNAKIADFGLCEFIDRDKNSILKIIRGTPGYIPPECLSMRTTEKADIYSFGIVLLEMICGRKNLNCPSKSGMHLLRLLQRMEENSLLDILENFDDDMQNHAEEVERMIKIAAWCLQNDYNRRPHSCRVVLMLEGVMNVETDLCFNFTFAMEESVLDIKHASATQEASILSQPR